MSDLTFNKYAGAALATGLVIVGLVQVSRAVFSFEPAAKPGYKVEVAADTAGGGAAAPEVPPDWGTVLPKADVAAGQAVFAKCQSCHSLTANGTGPDLMGVEGRHPASEPGYSYSDAMKGEAAKVSVWDYEHLYEYLKNPQAYVPGTKMTFVGLKAPEDRINLIAYLHTQGSSLPVPKPNPAAAAAAAPTTGPTGAAAAPGAAKAGEPTATAAAPPASNAGGPAGQGDKGAAPTPSSAATPASPNAGATKK